MTVKEKLIETLEHLTSDQHAQLLMIAQQWQTSPTPVGTSGATLIEALDMFTFSQGDVDEIMQIIHDNEEIDWDGWR